MFIGSHYYTSHFHQVAFMIDIVMNKIIFNLRHFSWNKILGNVTMECHDYTFRLCREWSESKNENWLKEHHLVQLYRCYHNIPNAG